MPTVSTIYAAFNDAAHSWGDRPFLHVLAETAEHYGIAADVLRYREASTQVEAIAERYRTAGYGIGHRVGIMLDNQPNAFLHWFALNKLGASVVPLNADLRPTELDHLMQHSGISLAVGTARRTPLLEDAVDRQAGPCIVMATDGDVPPAIVRAPDQAPDLHTECALLYTSGTSGKPKGCVLSNDYFLRCGRWYTEVGGLCSLRPGAERLITPLPMVHVNAMAYSTLAMVLTGGCIIPLDRFHPRTWWQSVRDSEATILHSLGVMPTMLLGLDPSPADRAHNVRFGFAPGIDPRYHAAFEARFGMPMIDAWAMTETGAGAVVIASHEPRHIGQSCFGRAPILHAASHRRSNRYRHRR